MRQTLPGACSGQLQLACRVQEYEHSLSLSANFSCGTLHVCVLCCLRVHFSGKLEKDETVAATDSSWVFFLGFVICYYFFLMK